LIKSRRDSTQSARSDQGQLEHSRVAREADDHGNANGDGQAQENGSLDEIKVQLAYSRLSFPTLSAPLQRFLPRNVETDLALIAQTLFQALLMWRPEKVHSTQLKLRSVRASSEQALWIASGSRELFWSRFRLPRAAT
jgi:hypothetical protein